MPTKLQPPQPLSLPLTAALLPRRFWDKVQPQASGCWQWTGSRRGGSGYGDIGFGHTRSELAHRLAYSIMVAPIPAGMQIDHLCRNRQCVNPSHLEVVTPRVNSLRGQGFAAMNARKTHCVRGHPLIGANTLLYRGWRYCRLCRRIFDQVRRLKRQTKEVGYAS